MVKSRPSSRCPVLGEKPNLRIQSGQHFQNSSQEISKLPTRHQSNARGGRVPIAKCDGPVPVCDLGENFATPHIASPVVYVRRG